jgi:hypothetical protein
MEWKEDRNRNAKPVVVEGIVKPDGSLEVEGKVPLPAGKVRVTVEALPWSFEDHPFYKMLERIWATHDRAELQPPRSAEEMEAEYRRYRNEEGKIPLPAVTAPPTEEALPWSSEDHPFWQMLRRIWAARELAGLQPRSVEEIEAARKQFRDGIEEEIAEAGRLQDESRRLREEAKRASKEER